MTRCGRKPRRIRRTTDHSGLMPANLIIYLGPFFRLVRHEPAEVGEPRLDARIGKGGINLAVEPVDDRGRRPLRRVDAAKIARLVARHELGHGWRVRPGLRAGWEKGQVE